MSCLSCGFRKETKKREKRKTTWNHTQRENSLERGLGGCLTDGKSLNEFSQTDQFHGQNVELTQGYFY